MKEREQPAVDDGHGNLVRSCKWCGEPVKQRSVLGHPRWYCTRSHRQRAFEARRLRGLRVAAGLESDDGAPH